MTAPQHFFDIQQEPLDGQTKGALNAQPKWVVEYLAQAVPKPEEAAQTADRPAEAAASKPHERSRLDADDFDIKAPVSNFRKVTDDVFRSGRPMVGKGGMEKLLDKVHPGKSDSYKRDNTVVIELRDENQKMEPAIMKLNAGEIADEAKYCRNSNPPIEYHHYRFISKRAESPDKIERVLKTIDSALQRGKSVTMHCFHGSDRSGLIASAYLISRDPVLKKELATDPDKAYQSARKILLKDGCDPDKYQQVYKNLREYCFWKNAQINGTAAPTQVPADVPIDAAQKQVVEDTARTMFTDPRFTSSPTEAYRDALLNLIDKYDPSTHNELYKAIHDKYVEGPKPQKHSSILPRLELEEAA